MGLIGVLCLFLALLAALHLDAPGTSFTRFTSPLAGPLAIVGVGLYALSFIFKGRNWLRSSS
jgi:hypothetical protein